MHERERGEHPPLHQRILATYHVAADRYRSHPGETNLQVLAHAAHVLESALLMIPGKFDLGQIVATPGARATLHRADQLPAEFLLPHHHGEWGELDPEDLAENERALREGSRLVSSYRTRTDEKLWVITEWDRSVTTILRPDEY